MSETLLNELSEELKTQDNACTADPLYCVQQKRRIYGIDAEYCDLSFYSLRKDPDCKFETRDDALAELAKEGFSEDDFDEKFDTVGYIEIWEFVTAHLTRKAAQLYIDQNSHNLRLPRIYVSSQYRCHEFNAAVAFMRDDAPLLLEACKAMVHRFGPCECYPDPAPPCSICAGGWIDLLVREVSSLPLEACISRVDYIVGCLRASVARRLEREPLPPRGFRAFPVTRDPGLEAINASLMKIADERGGK
jgi:hypothetical protein